MISYDNLVKSHQAFILPHRSISQRSSQYKFGDHCGVNYIFENSEQGGYHGSVLDLLFFLSTCGIDSPLRVQRHEWIVQLREVIYGL